MGLAKISNVSSQRILLHLSIFLMIVATIIGLAHAVMFTWLNFDILTYAYAGYYVLVLATLLRLRKPDANVKRIAKFHVWVLMFLISTVIIYLGGIGHSASFTFWLVLGPVITIIFHGSRSIIIVSITYILAILGCIAYSMLGGPVFGVIPDYLVPFVIGSNILGASTTIAVTLGYVIRVMQKEHALSAATQSEALKAQKLTSLGVLAGGIAHDFNNLLTAFLGNVDMARHYARTGKTNKVNKLLTEAETALDSARHLTGQLLTFAKGGTPVKELCSPAKIIRESLMLVLHGTRTSHSIQIQDRLFWIHADAGQLAQLVRNLVLNGVQAMPEGGRIRISANNLTKAPAHTGLEPGPAIRLEITDSGCGIPPNIANSIFDPYFTTRPNGSGLGLSICHTIVQNHNWHISFESTADKGTTFTIYLPATAPEPLPIAKKPLASIEPAHSGRVLVMDDEPAILEVLKLQLEHLGYVPVCAPDGKAAVSEYEASISRGEPFSAAILDLTVKGGMGGEEAVSKMREIDDSSIFIASSGYVNSEVLSQPEKYGFSGVLPKPYGIKRLAKTLIDSGVASTATEQS